MATDRRVILTAAGLLGAGLSGGACSTGAPDPILELVPITVIAAGDSASLTVTMLTSDCIDDTTEVRVSEAGGETISIAVRHGADSCDDVMTFTDIEVRLDGPLGARRLELVQPPDSAARVGSDVCIIDGVTDTERCSIVVGED